MNNRLRAASWILCDSDATVKEQLECLENQRHAEICMDCETISPWEPFEKYSPAEILEQIDRLEKEFDQAINHFKNSNHD